MEVFVNKYTLVLGAIFLLTGGSVFGAQNPRVVSATGCVELVSVTLPSIAELQSSAAAVATPLCYGAVAEVPGTSRQFERETYASDALCYSAKFNCLSNHFVFPVWAGWTSNTQEEGLAEIRNKLKTVAADTCISSGVVSLTDIAESCVPDGNQPFFCSGTAQATCDYR